MDTSLEITTTDAPLQVPVREPGTTVTASNGRTGILVNAPLDLVVANRYQKSDRDKQGIPELAENIHQHGLKQYPIGRLRPEGPPGTIELADGARRTASFRLLFQTDPFYSSIPIIVQEMTDQELFETCILANEKRESLSAIQRAVALRDYMDKFHVTQGVAGRLFDLKQTSVAHLMELLGLPLVVQDLVDKKLLPETPARTLARFTKLSWRGDLVIEIGQKAVEAEPGRVAGTLEALVDQALSSNAPRLDTGVPWPLAWPGDPLPVPVPLMLGAKDRPNAVPACDGCAWNMKRGDKNNEKHYCLRSGCFETKGILWSEHEIARAAEKVGIPAAAAGESTVLIYPTAGTYDSYSERQDAKALAFARLPELRIVARQRDKAGNYVGQSYGIEDILGSQAVALATTNPAAVSVFLNKARGKTPAALKVPARTANESPAATAKRLTAEKAQAAARSIERTAYNRSHADVLWVCEHTARLIAERTEAAGGLLGFVAEVVSNRYNVNSNFAELVDAAKRLDEAAHMDDLDHFNSRGHKRTGAPAAVTPEVDLARRQYLAYSVIASDVTSGYKPTQTVFGNFKDARDKCEDAAVTSFGISLPAGWDTPPIHKGALNCWTCGIFSASGSGKLTKADEHDGWRAVMGSKPAEGEELQGVFCPEHAAAGVAEWNKSQLKAKSAKEDADWKAMAAYIGPKAPAPIVKPAKAPGAAGEARARAMNERLATAAAKVNGAGHGRRHTSPAPKPKPAAKRTARRKVAKKGK